MSFLCSSKCTCYLIELLENLLRLLLSCLQHTRTDALLAPSRTLLCTGAPHGH